MNPKTVLLIDDNQFLVQTLSDKLKHAQFKVITSFEGEDGIKKAQQFLPNIILLDLMMPGINGLETLQKLKSIETTKQIPVIILTNISDDNISVKIQSLGGTGYMLKTDQSLDAIVEAVSNLV